MAGDNSINEDAAKTAAIATGLRPDQIKVAVEEYRAAADALYGEPKWQSVMHLSGKGWALSQYADPDGETQITLQIESVEKRGHWRQEPHRYVLKDGTVFETFGEARAAEIKTDAKFKLHPVISQ